MKFLIFIICAILGSSVSIPVEDSSQPTRVHTNNKGQRIYTSSMTKHTNLAHDISTDKKEYFFVNDVNGGVIIMDADTYEAITNYTLPEIQECLVITVDDKFYSIDTLNGFINVTDISNILPAPQDTIDWTTVASFPPEEKSVLDGAIAEKSTIYFITETGKIYSYDTISKTLVLKAKRGNVRRSFGFSQHLLKVNNILYAYIGRTLFTVKDNNLEKFKSQTYINQSVPVEINGKICLVGGEVDLYPGPVYCYEEFANTWLVHSYIKEPRMEGSIAISESGIHLFGGETCPEPDFCLYKRSIEKYNAERRIWSFVPSPFTEGRKRHAMTVRF